MATSPKKRRRRVTESVGSAFMTQKPADRVGGSIVRQSSQTRRTIAKLIAIVALISIPTLTVGGSATPAGADSGNWGPYPVGFAYLAFAPDGTLYPTDPGNARIYRIGGDGSVTVVAGTGDSGFQQWTKDHGWVPAGPFSGDGGPAIDAEMDFTVGIAIDGAGTIYAGDHGNDRVRRIDRNWIITTYAGNGVNDPFFKGPFTPGTQQSGDGGPATQASLDAPWGIDVDAAGNLYIADRDHDAIRRVDMSGVITTIAGSGQRGYSGDGGPATKAKLNRVTDVAVGPDGTLYIADENNSRIRKVTPAGIITTIAGTAEHYGCGGNGGPATEAPVQNPSSITVGPDGSVYVGEGECHVFRRITPSGTIERVAGTGAQGCSGFNGPALQMRVGGTGDVAFGPDGDLYITACRRIIRIDANGMGHVVATGIGLP
jgi:NHL repeat-containing protein